MENTKIMGDNCTQFCSETKFIIGFHMPQVTVVTMAFSACNNHHMLTKMFYNIKWYVGYAIFCIKVNIFSEKLCFTSIHVQWICAVTYVHLHIILLTLWTIQAIFVAMVTTLKTKKSQKVLKILNEYDPRYKITSLTNFRLRSPLGPFSLVQHHMTIMM